MIYRNESYPLGSITPAKVLPEVLRDAVKSSGPFHTTKSKLTLYGGCIAVPHEHCHCWDAALPDGGKSTTLPDGSGTASARNRRGGSGSLGDASRGR